VLKLRAVEALFGRYTGLCNAHAPRGP
jgi:hypothetical protein